MSHFIYYYDERHYAECHYAECYILFTIMLSVIMLSVTFYLLLCLVSHFIYYYDECHYTECRYAECRSAHSHARANVINFFCPLFTNFRNKVECLSLAGLTSLV